MPGCELFPQDFSATVRIRDVAGSSRQQAPGNVGGMTGSHHGHERLLPRLSVQGRRRERTDPLALRKAESGRPRSLAGVLPRLLGIGAFYPRCL